MKILRFMLIPAALLGGCAPYEHGHYIEDVSYGNAAGDPPGTPILFSRGSGGGSGILDAGFSDHVAYDDHHGGHGGHPGPEYIEAAHTIETIAAPSIIEPHYSSAAFVPASATISHAPLITASAPILAHDYAPPPPPRPAHLRHSIDVTPSYAAPTVSVDHHYAPTVSVDHHYEPSVSVDHHYAPSVSVDHSYTSTHIGPEPHHVSAPFHAPHPIKKKKHRHHHHDNDTYLPVASANYETVGPYEPATLAQPLPVQASYVDVTATSVSAPHHYEPPRHIEAPHHIPAPPPAHHIPAPIAQPAPERITAPAQYVQAPDIRMQAPPVYAPGMGLRGYGQGFGTAPAYGQGYGPAPVPASHVSGYPQAPLPPVPYGFGPSQAYGGPQIGFPPMPGYGMGQAQAQNGCVTYCGGNAQVF